MDSRSLDQDMNPKTAKYKVEVLPAQRLRKISKSTRKKTDLREGTAGSEECQQTEFRAGTERQETI